MLRKKMTKKVPTLEEAEAIGKRYRPNIGVRPSTMLNYQNELEELRKAIIDKEPLEEQIYRLRVSGASSKDISNRQGMKKTPEEIDEIIASLAEKSRQRLVSELSVATILEVDRMEKILKALWPAVEDGDLGAIDRILVVSRERRKLLGLDAPEMKMNLTSDTSQIDLSSLSLKQIQAWEDIQKTLTESKRTNKMKQVKGKDQTIEGELVTAPVAKK